MWNWTDYPTARGSFIAKVAPPENEPTDGEQVTVCFSREWLPYVLGATTQLMLQATWDSDDDALIRLTQARADRLIQQMAREGCNTGGGFPTPFWDDTGDLDDQTPGEENIWYGDVEDSEAPADELTWRENASIWLVTGFLAYAGDIGAALFFRSIAPRFVLAFNKGDLREIWRIVVDGADYGRVDTDDYDTGDVIERNIITDPELLEHEIMIVKVTP